MAQLHHSTLGKIQGKRSGEVTQYLGLKYASLGHRFGQPELYSGDGSSAVIDGTKLGPAAIAPPGGCSMEHTLIQQSLPLPEFPPPSDTECLNLNITVPTSQVSEQKLPVFVFIHGGALAMGSNCWPQYDQAGIVRRSAELGLPCIGVGINYRTGIFGFLTSEELRGAGFLGNNGLRDQKVAFQWIQRHIAGFGGNPDMVTVVGQSAGGVSATLLLQSAEPLFQRMVDMAGTCLLLRPLPPFVHEMFYQQFCQVQGLEGLSPQERLKAIERMDSTEMVLKMPPSIPSLPLLDGNFIHDAPTFTSAETWSKSASPAFPGLKWCQELFVGDSQMDGSIYCLALGGRQEGIAKAFAESLKRNIPNHEADIDSLLAAYHVSEKTDDSAAYLAILEFANDICFYLPAETFARNWPGKTYLYHLNEPNPWDGPFKGVATHIFDVALLFGNYQQSLGPSQRAVGQAMADHVIKFVNGHAPWPAFQSDKPAAMVYGGGAGNELRENKPENVGRRSAMFGVEDSITWDALHEAFIAFLGGR